MKTLIAALTILIHGGTAYADDFTLIPMSHLSGPGSLDFNSKALVTNGRTGQTRLYIGEVRQAAHNGPLIIKASFFEGVMVGGSLPGVNLRHYPAFPAASDNSVAGKEYFWQLNAVSGDVYFCRIAPGSTDKPYFCTKAS